MIKEISFCTFCDEFTTTGRQNQFSYEGKKALFEYLEKYEESTGEKIDLDVIGLCCDFTEYENLKELQDNYSDIKSMEDLETHTIVIPIYDNNGQKTDSFIIQNY